MRKIRIKNKTVIKRKKEKKSGKEWLILVVVFCFIVLGVKFYEFMDRGVILNSINIRCDKGIDGDTLSDIIGVKPGANMYKVNIKKISRALSVSSRINRAYVRRNFLDGKIEIDMEERKPLMRISDGDFRNCIDVDENGTVIGKTKNLSGDVPFVTVAGSDYPVLPGDEGKTNGAILKAIELLKTAKSEGIPLNWISELNLSDADDYVFLMDGGIEFHLGSDELQNKLKRLNRIINEIKEKGVVVEYVDLRFGDEAYLKPIKTKVSYGRKNNG